MSNITYVPIQDLTSKNLADTDLIPVTDGATAYGVPATQFKTYTTAAAEAAAEAAEAAAAHLVIDDTLSIPNAAADAAKVGDLKAAISDAEMLYGANATKTLMIDLWPTSGYIDGKYLNYDTGRESTSNQYFISPYIPVVPGEKYVAWFVDNAPTCFYDISKGYVSGIQASRDVAFTIPAGCFYMRMSPKKSNVSYIRLYQAEQLPSSTHGSHASVVLEDISNDITNIGRLINASVYQTLADLPANSIATIAYSSFSDSPVAAVSEDLIFTTAGSYPIQLYLTSTGTLFRRIYINGWNPWQEISAEANTVAYATPSTLIPLLKRYNGTRATIILDNSEYNLNTLYKEYYGADFWTNYNGYGGVSDPFYRGLWLENINVIGSGQTKITYSGDRTTAIMRDFALIAPAGDVTLKNVTLEIGLRNIRYAIHDDFTANRSYPSHIRYENIIMRGTGVSNGLIGGGCGTGCVYEVINCMFEDNAGDFDMFYHNYVNATPANRITVSGCLGQKKCTFRPYGTATDITECAVNNSQFLAITKEPVDSEAYDNMRVVKFLCVETGSN